MQDQINKKERHGMCGTRPYAIWCGIKRRCYNKNEKTYTSYGAKGIKMSREWKNSFSAFWNDMKDTYFETGTIDRISNTKGYSKENCRWLTLAKQSENRRHVILYDYKGRKVSLGGLEKELGLTKGLLSHRVKKLKWSLEKSIQNPKIQRKSNFLLFNFRSV